jgi:hypothetical protein
MEREQASGAIQEVLRGITHTKKGKMKIQRWHVKKAINSNARQKLIGKQRADKIWGWVAGAVDKGEHALKDKGTWKQEWLSAEERAILAAREDAAWAGGEREQRQAHCAEVTGAVMTWITENEEPQKEGPWELRPQKLSQMMAAKKAMAKPRGGRKAIYAALTKLTMEGKIRLTETPNKSNNGSDRGGWKEWKEEMIDWMLEQRWVSEEGAGAMREAVGKVREQHQRGKQHIAVDMGEGWGSVRRALQALPGVKVIGIDRRGHTYTGVKHGVITAAVHHDLTVRGKKDLLTTIAKKVGPGPSKWTLLWMSLECSSMSVANAMNQGTGSAHGKWASTEKNKVNATAERIQQETEYLRESEETLRNVMHALEAHPKLRFALENPATSQTWKATPVKDAMERHPEWKLIRVDQCAYGRRSQKPTSILTNLQNWTPKGRTGNGKCKLGACGGTEHNERGDGRHEEQTVPNSKDRRPKQGEKHAGRWDFTKEAVTNSVAEELVAEIMKTAMVERTGSGSREK